MGSGTSLAYSTDDSQGAAQGLAFSQKCVGRGEGREGKKVRQTPTKTLQQGREDKQEAGGGRETFVTKLLVNRINVRFTGEITFKSSSPPIILCSYLADCPPIINHTLTDAALGCSSPSHYE